MDDDFGIGICVGAAAAALIVALLATAMHYWGQNECQQHLPRTQQCEKKWVAP